MTEKSEELDPKELECLMKVIEATPPVIEVMKICLNLQKEHGDIPVDKVIMRADEQSRATVYNALKWLEDNEFIYHKIGERGKYAFKKGWIDIFEKKVKDKRKTIDSGLEKIKELKKTIEIPWLPEEEISVIPGTLELISILANSFKDEDFKTVLIYTHFLPRIFITSLKSKKEILPFLRKKKFLSIIPTSLPEKPERKIEGLYEKIHEEVGVKLEYLQIPTKYPLIQRNTLICFLKHDLRDVVNKWKPNYILLRESLVDRLNKGVKKFKIDYEVIKEFYDILYEENSINDDSYMMILGKLKND